MVFYFSGTGNSLAAANVLKCCDEVLNIADCLRSRRFEFSPAPDEPVILCLPVYFGGLPTVAEDFFKRFRLRTRPSGLYGVLTYGGREFDSPLVLRDALLQVGAPLTAVFTVRMPANFVIFYEIADDEQIAHYLEKSGARLAAIRAFIRDGAPNPGSADLSRPLPPDSPSVRGREKYDELRKTSHFHVADTCVHCGVCASRCPTGALVMRDDTPTWVKDECCLCMACVRCGAILYDDLIGGRKRYVHPDLKKKKQADNEHACH